MSKNKIKVINYHRRKISDQMNSYNNRKSEIIPQG